MRNDANEVEKLAKKKQRPISYDEGVLIAKKIKAAKYVECSALNQVGLKDVFDEAILTVLNKSKPKKSSCALL